MCFTETQWKEGTKPLCQTPLKNGKAALQGPGPWRSRMSLRKRQRRQVFPTAPAQGRQGVTTVTYLLPPLLTVTCFLDAFGGLFLLVNTQTALLAARIPFERKCFPNDRALPKKTQKKQRQRETDKAGKNGKAQKQSQVLGKRENTVNGHWSPPGGLSAEASAVGGLCDKDVCREPGGAVYRARFCKPHSHVNAAAM